MTKNQDPSKWDDHQLSSRKMYGSVDRSRVETAEDDRVIGIPHVMTLNIT